LRLDGEKLTHTQKKGKRNFDFKSARHPFAEQVAIIAAG
jgi:hypothetical protein